MADNEGLSEGLKQALLKKGKAKQPTQGFAGDIVSAGSSSLPAKSLLLPIVALSPEQKITNWEIQGLVVCKSELKPYKNELGLGIYFSFEMRDQAGGEIRVVCFQSEVSRFYDKVVEGKEHVLTRGKLTKPKAEFNRMNRTCEIVLDYDSDIRVIESLDDERNKSLVEIVTEIMKDLEVCTGKLQELETEIRRKGKVSTKHDLNGVVEVKTESQVMGISENRKGEPQGERKEFSGMRKTSSSTTRGSGLGTLARSLPKSEEGRRSSRP